MQAFLKEDYFSEKSVLDDLKEDAISDEEVEVEVDPAQAPQDQAQLQKATVENEETAPRLMQIPAQTAPSRMSFFASRAEETQDELRQSLLGNSMNFSQTSTLQSQQPPSSSQLIAPSDQPRVMGLSAFASGDDTQELAASIICEPMPIPAKSFSPEKIEKIERIFKKILSSQYGYQEAVIRSLIETYPLQQKYAIVKNFDALQKKDEEYLSDIDKFLALQDVTLLHLKDINLLLCTHTNYILDYFLKQDGMDFLFLTLKSSPFLMNKKSEHEIEFITELIQLLRKICQVKSAMNKFIENQNLANTIVLLLDSTNLELKRCVLELFSLACIYTNKETDRKGFSTIIQAFDHYKLIKQEKRRFAHLVTSMKNNKENFEYLTACMILFNSMLNYASNIATSKIIEKQVLDLGLNKALHEVQIDNIVLPKKLQAQIEVFQKNLSHKYDVALNEPANLAKAIEVHLGGTQANNYYLNILQYLYIYCTTFDIKEDVLNENWRILENVVKRSVTTNKDGVIDDLTPGELKAKGTIEMQQKQILELEEKERKQYELLAQYLEQLKKIQQPLTIPQQHGDQQTELDKFSLLKQVQDTMNELSNKFSKESNQYEQQIFKLREELKLSKKKIDLLQQGKPIDDLPEGESDVLSPTQVAAQPPPPPPMPANSIPPPPPPPPPSLGIGNTAISSLPTLPQYSHKESMRNFHWNRISQAHVSNTIFIKKNLVKNIRNFKLETDKLEMLFSLQQKTPKVCEAPKLQQTPKNVKVSLIPPKRSSNVAIILKNLKMSNEEIRNAILEMDSEKLTSEHIEALSKIIPTQEEIDMINGYTGSKDSLSETEKFFAVVNDIPNLSERFTAWSVSYRFTQLLNSIRPDIDFIINACKEVTTNQGFLQLLETVLAIGNFLNGKKNGSYGFRMDSLLKLKDTKSCDNRTDLLLYIVQYVKETESLKEASEFYKEFKSVLHASRIDSIRMNSEIKELQQGLRIVEKQLKESNDKPVSADEKKQGKFLSFMEKFFYRASNQLHLVQQKLDDMNVNCMEIAKLFGEDEKDLCSNPSKFFDQICQFIKMFKESEMKYNEWKEAENKRRLFLQKRQEAMLLQSQMKTSQQLKPIHSLLQTTLLSESIIAGNTLNWEALESGKLFKQAHQHIANRRKSETGGEEEDQEQHSDSENSDDESFA